MTEKLAGTCNSFVEHQWVGNAKSKPGKEENLLCPKRIFDLFVSLLLLALFLPTLFPVLSLLVMLTSKGGPLFIQKRTGLNRKTFLCYKFRTMHVHRRPNQADDFERVTTVGKFLRAAHLDELPQLVNVVLGDMSLVGPRPHMLRDTIKFEQTLPAYAKRHVIRPGITGLAQVSGFYGNVDSLAHLEFRVKYDLEYIETRSLAGDIQIVLKTFTMPIYL